MDIRLSYPTNSVQFLPNDSEIISHYIISHLFSNIKQLEVLKHNSREINPFICSQTEEYLKAFITYQEICEVDKGNEHYTMLISEPVFI